MILKKTIFYLIAIALVMASCDSGGWDDSSFELPKSSENKITSFTIENVKIAIDQKNFAITGTVPYEANLEKAKPILQLSDKATVSPSSGQTVNLNNTTVYTVTAENGTKQEYVVTLMRSAFNPRLTGFGSKYVAPGNNLTLKGYFLAGKTSVFYYKTDGTLVSDLSIEKSSTSELEVLIHPNSQAGEFIIKVVSADVELTLKETFTILPKAGVTDKDAIVDSEKLFTIAGSFIQNKTAVLLKKGNEASIATTAKNVTQTSFQAAIPSNLAFGRYRVILKVDNIETVTDKYVVYSGLTKYENVYVQAGTELVLNGFFVADKTNFILMKDGVDMGSLTINSKSESQIKLYIHPNNVAGDFNLKMKIDGTDSEIVQTFTVLPSISDKTMTVVGSNRILNLTGKFIADKPNRTAVYLKDGSYTHALTVTSVTANSMTVNVPASVPAAEYKVSLKVDSKIDIATEKPVICAAFSSFSNSTLQPGGTLIINGYWGPNKTEVRLMQGGKDHGGLTLTYQGIMTLNAYIHPGTVPGVYTLAITVDGKAVAVNSNFTVEAPATVE